MYGCRIGSKYLIVQERKDNRKVPQNTVNLQTTTIKADGEDERDRHLRFCFRVVSPSKTYILQAENELERKEWMEFLQVRGWGAGAGSEG
jgi:PH domain